MDTARVLSPIEKIPVGGATIVVAIHKFMICHKSVSNFAFFKAS